MREGYDVIDRTMTHLAVVDVDLALGAREAFLADAREAGDAVDARGARRARVRLALVDIDRTVLSCAIISIIISVVGVPARNVITRYAIMKCTDR